jgi:hypothetical protein
MNKRFYRVYFDEGSYTQRQFLCEDEDDAQDHVDRLNGEYGITFDEDGNPSDVEFWKYDSLNFDSKW